MKITTFEEWKAYYEKTGTLPNDVGNRRQRLNDIQLHSRFDKYQEQQRRVDTPEVDERWQEVRSKIDLSRCRLCARLKESSMPALFEDLRENAGHLFFVIDPAHVLRRSAFPGLIYDIGNIVPLNRWSHSMLDQYCSPIDGKSISKERHDEWWYFILGRERYTALMSLAGVHTPMED